MVSYEDEHQVTPPAATARRRILQTEVLWQRAFENEPLDGSFFTPEFEQELENLRARFGDAQNGQGMPQTFVDSLDRVDKKLIKAGDSCAICSEDYLDDPFPLVVTLPCPGRHNYDLDCISPWLKRNSTCPLCRHDMSKPKEPIAVDVDEDDYDDMYA